MVFRIGQNFLVYMGMKIMKASMSWMNFLHIYLRRGTRWIAGYSKLPPVCQNVNWVIATIWSCRESGSNAKTERENRCRFPSLLSGISPVFIGVKSEHLSGLRFSMEKSKLARTWWCCILSPSIPRRFNTLPLRCQQCFGKVLQEGTLRHWYSSARRRTFRKQFAGYPEIIRNTQELLWALQDSVWLSRKQNKQTFSGSRLLTKIFSAGKDLQGKRNTTTEKKMKLCGQSGSIRKSYTINEFGFAAYFLINWDIVRHAQHQGYFMSTWQRCEQYCRVLPSHHRCRSDWSWSLLWTGFY